ncbi:sensor histidine kinase [Anaerocolumna sp. MB42-C2]|uniref:sensor histidine kinase n=1 Tax=Anaerocolumna sp. MB42-C2 TaxID=3070997 RepID=UPI0027E1C829|nr:histidine kinase [Anaerocolumna sp. MB42-C2]WMJ88665.1 histidine kinase [Anaerocolumna sp. MB42-C2]
MKEKQGLTYRTKLIGFFLLATVITTLVGLYNYTSSRVLMKNMTDMLNKSQELTTVYNELNQIQNNLEVYLSTRSSDSLQSFYDHSNSITYNNSILKSDEGFSDRGIKIKNLTGMVDHYLKILDETVVDKRNKKINEYTSGYQEAVKEYNYIGNYIQEIMSTDLSDSAQKYIELKKEADQTAMINYFLFGITIILISVILVLFSIEITKPISKLVSYAKEVSDGNFDVEITDEKTSSEISILYQTFHRMTISIKEYVNELKEKQRLERTLIEEKLDNLKMKNALHEAELLALQSQVNPHFIFNSINIGAKVAMLQGDDITCEYLENFADIFRYNLKGLDYNATLQEEINNVAAYMNLLITRFGDIIDFRLSEPEDDSIKNFIMPRMTLQPLVENAYIHGVSKFEDGGIIELKTAKDGNRINITISNTGDEFPKETIEMILNRKFKAQKDPSKKGHTTGIGLDNVLNRLRLFYEENDVMNITCVDGKTNVILSLPLNFKKEAEYRTTENV